MKAIFQYIIAACLLILSAFVAFYLFLAMLVVGVCVFAYIWVRRFFGTRQTPHSDAAPMQADITIIEGQFETVEVKPEPLAHQQQESQER